MRIDRIADAIGDVLGGVVLGASGIEMELANMSSGATDHSQAGALKHEGKEPGKCIPEAFRHSADEHVANNDGGDTAD